MFLHQCVRISSRNKDQFLIKRKDNAMKEYIENVLAPKLQGDGGWVEFVSYENKKLTLIFRGECSKCLILNRCVDWIAQQIKEAKGETVEITAVRKKPFFWDNV
ncbi:NifU family protein [Firmicutes bacterium AF25-13AC]|nr:NifU family protein [Firmicutes bacterium AF25-13AC]